MNGELFPILLAEDSEHDIMAVERAWKKHGFLNPLHVVRDGEECLNYLHQRGAYAPPNDFPRPGLLLLDLNMPRMGGMEVLEHIRGEDHLKHLPVVILTTSNADRDRAKSYDLGANAYIMKPVSFESFSEAIQTIQLFWQLVELPE